VSVFRIIDRHNLCLIFTVDVESHISRVVHVVDDPDTNENATQAGFLMLPKRILVMSKMLNVIMSLLSVIRRITPQQRDG